MTSFWSIKISLPSTKRKSYQSLKCLFNSPSKHLTDPNKWYQREFCLVLKHHLKRYGILHNIPLFSKEYFDDWKIRKAHLAAQDNDILYVIIDDLIKILNENTPVAVIEGASQMVAEVNGQMRIKWKQTLIHIITTLIFITEIFFF